MQTISTTATHTDLMAAWLATGGAIEPAQAAAETAGDDGLSTAPHTFIVYCVEDSGLAAMGPSVQFPCRAEDGLEALSVSRACVGAEGLKAGSFTNPYQCR